MTPQRSRYRRAWVLGLPREAGGQALCLALVLLPPRGRRGSGVRAGPQGRPRSGCGAALRPERPAPYDARHPSGDERRPRGRLPGTAGADGMGALDRDMEADAVMLLPPRLATWAAAPGDKTT